jgi:hypothetical protein
LRRPEGGQAPPLGSRPLERGGELAGQLGLEFERGSSHGMGEPQPVRVQELALETDVAPHAIRHIPGDGKLDSSEVNANLVRSPCLEPDIEESVLRQELDHLEPRHGIARLVRVERSPGRIAAIPADGGVDPTGSRLRSPAYEREVAALDLTPTDRLLEGRERVLRASHDQEPGSFSVETVHDPGPLGIASRCTQREKLSRKRSRPGSGAGVDGHARRLVDHDQVCVLVGERDGRRLRPEAGRAVGKLHLDQGARVEPVALRPDCAVDRHEAVVQQALGERTRPDLGALGDGAVETRPRLRLSDAETKCRQRALRASDAAGRRGRARRRESPRRQR